MLNYALTLEFLEAEFYRQGNSAGLLSGKEQQYLETVQVHEESHVATITATIERLGGSPRLASTSGTPSTAGSSGVHPRI